MSKSSSSSKTLDSHAHVLVVEDESDLQDLLRYNLGREGFTVTSALTGEQALAAMTDRPADLVLLDLMLPGIDGLEVCRRFKANPQWATVPVVMVTAKGEEADVVTGLELGADDYIVKPFSPRVLLARLRAVLRRRATEAKIDEQPADPIIEIGALRINPTRHEVTADGQAIDLTATEFRLLSQLARRPGRVFTRQQIIDAVHGGQSAVTDRSVDVQVVSLRRKLGELGDLIQTVRGVGYRFKEG